MCKIGTNPCKCGETLIEHTGTATISDNGVSSIKSYCKCGEIRSIKFIIPIESINKKKWWEFWKKDISAEEAKKSLDELISSYKKDIDINEITGEITINDHRLPITKEYLF